MKPLHLAIHVFWLTSALVPMTMIGSAWAEAMGSSRTTAHATEFRWSKDAHDCRNSQNASGWNYNHVGECGKITVQLTDPSPYSGTMPDYVLASKLPKAPLAMPGLYVSTYSTLPNMDFHGSELSGATFQSGEMPKANFQDVQGSWMNISFIDMKGANFDRASLRNGEFYNAQFQGASFRNTDFRNATFSGVHMEGADLRGTDLRGVELWRSTTLTGARFNERTLMDMSCRDALAAGMVWTGEESWDCDARPPRLLTASEDFKHRYPGLLLVLRGDDSEVRLYHEDGLQIRPIDPADVPQEDLLCAALLDRCLNDRNAVMRQYSVDRVPPSILDAGIDLYHSPYPAAERLGRLRLIGGFRVAENPRLAAYRNDPGLRDAVIAELARLKVRGGVAAVLDEVKVTWRTLINDAQEVFVEPHWMDLDQEGSRFACTPSRADPDATVSEIHCQLSTDFFKASVDAPNWAERVVEGLVRAADTFTASVNLRLNRSTQAALGSNVRLVVPVGKLNVQTIDETALRKR